jgi:hypothetical protein
VAAVTFIEIETVFDLHRAALRRFGGSGGVRDRGLIESALGAAQNAFFYGNADIFEIAAAYAFHLRKPKPFWTVISVLQSRSRWFSSPLAATQRIFEEEAFTMP